MKVLEIKCCNQCPCYHDSDDDEEEFCKLDYDLDYTGFSRWVSDDCHPECPLKEDSWLIQKISSVVIPSCGGAVAEPFEEDK